MEEEEENHQEQKEDEEGLHKEKVGEEVERQDAGLVFYQTCCVAFIFNVIIKISIN